MVQPTLDALTSEQKEPEQEERRARSPKVKNRLVDLLGPARISGIYLWIVLIVVFSLWLPDTFPTMSTVTEIAGSQAIPGLATIGILFSLAAGVYDLSIGYTITVVSVLEATLMANHDSVVASIVVGMSAALVIGAVNGLVVVVFKINSFIGTLATSSVLEGIAVWISGNRTIVDLPPNFLRLGTAQPGGVPVAVIYLLVLAAIAWYLLEHTPFGRRLYAAGFGREAARLAGVRTDLLTFVSLIITALTAGIAGTVLAAQVGSASPDVGSSYLLAVFAAAFLGATQIKPGRMNVIGALVAIYLLATGSTGLQLAGAASWVSYVFNGAALVIAVGVSGMQERWRARATSRALRRRAESRVEETPGS